MSRPLETSNEPECRRRMERCEKALDDLKWAAFELKLAGAKRAHAYTLRARKSAQGAYNHARMRWRTAAMGPNVRTP